MCGIGALIAVPGDQHSAGLKLMAALRHRGPDHQAIANPVAGVTLVHTRLAIIDVHPDSHQPMASRADGAQQANWITYNGEVFNFPALRAELEDAGTKFRTRSDTEVILASYASQGPSCIERFRGMFAFCIVDSGRGIALLARDHLGIKPLYLLRPPKGGLACASEIRALLSLGPEYVSRHIHAGALESYLAQGAVMGEQTLLDDIRLLPPGTHLTVDLQTGREVSRRRYWQLPGPARQTATRMDAVEELSHLVRGAVRDRLVSDVPLGVFLSGGVDSTAVLALAAEASPQPLRTITVGFDQADYDETAEAAETAAAFGTRHESVRIGASDIISGLPEVLGAMDQPTVDGANTFFVSRAARQVGLTVTLSGLGGDELFGGYATFRDVPRALRARRLWPFGVPDLLRNAARTRVTAKVVEALSRQRDPLSAYLLRRELLLPHERRALKPAVPVGTDPVLGLDREMCADLQARSGGLDLTNTVSLFELELYMRNMLLRDADTFSMAAPVECRVPFLDPLVVETVLAYPGSWKRPDPRPKPLLVDLVGARMPDAPVRQKKRGFTFPWGEWFSSNAILRERAQSAAMDTSLWQSLNLEPDAVRQLWGRWPKGDRRLSPLQPLAFVALHDYATRHKLAAA